MNIKRVDFDNQIKMAYERGLAKGRHDALAEAAKVFEQKTFNQRIECITKLLIH